ncbi:MAG: polyphosphate kinase 2 family protein [Bacteroidetes bacterium]|nr:polyphosphate kinase 2 family protein [Bacteroidota bacterium]
MPSIDLNQFAYTGDRKLSIADAPNSIDKLYDDKKEYREKLEKYQDEIDELQYMMYAHDRHAMLLVFQAMDAAGKDGTIKRVMSRVNPHGVSIDAFKKPSEEELDHDFMWRTTIKFPKRGTIGIFNRSYYEEVLVVKVHPKIVTDYQRIPKNLTIDLDKLWQQRYEDIRNLELYASRNGIHVVKFFLNISRDEQRDRFLARLNTPEKNWKFAEGDVKERGYWNDYMKAYEEAINETAAPHAPWYVIPADDKNNMRLIVAQVILKHLKALDMKFPEVSEDRIAEFEKFREMLEND